MVGLGRAENKIGLEAEFLLRSSDGDLVFPSDYGFDTDEFMILGEFRTVPQDSVEKCIGAFYESFYTLKRCILDKDKGLRLDIEHGFDTISSEFNAKILRKMGSKQINESLNIYGTDILTLSDAVIKGGKVIGRKISTGFHIHFSSVNTTSVSIPKFVDIPNYGKYHVNDEQKQVSVSSVTKPVIAHFVKRLDAELLPRFINSNYKNLKYRQPGFYELKSHGFEYRSMPFDLSVIDRLDMILEFCFNLFKDL